MASLFGEYNPTVPNRIIFGQGKAASLASEVEKLGGKKVLVLSGRTIADKTDTVRQVNESLGHLSTGVYSALTQRAPLSSAVEAANLAVAEGVDTLVGVGGSTISDAARMIAVLMTEGITTVDQLRELSHHQNFMLTPDLEGKPIPLQVSIPTTLSAGEFSMGGGNVIDEEAGHKIRVGHRRVYADLIVLDPEMTVGTPDWLWLSTGVKALDHCIERLYCRGNQPAIDAPVLKAAELLFNYLPGSREGAGDAEARLQCLVGAWLSMMGAPNFTMGLSHAMGHIIGVKYSVGHGYTSCVTQPYVMEFNRPISADKQALLACSAGLDTRGMSDESASEAAARAVDHLILELGLPHRLRDLKIREDELPLIAEAVLTDGGCRSNPVPVTNAEQVMEVLTNAY